MVCVIRQQNQGKMSLFEGKNPQNSGDFVGLHHGLPIKMRWSKYINKNPGGYSNGSRNSYALKAAFAPSPTAINTCSA
jgi:hypothetical protein